MTQTDEPLYVPVVWPLKHDLPTLPANQFAFSRTTDGVYMTFGELRPLTITEDSAQKHREELMASGRIEIQPLAVVFVTEKGFEALLKLMVNALDRAELKTMAQHITRLLEAQEREEE